MKVEELTQQAVSPDSGIDLTAQQTAVAEIGIYALEETQLQPILDKALRLTCKILATDFCKILELQPEEESFLLKSGSGWPAELVGQQSVPNDFTSQAGYTLAAGVPVIVTDFETETRFSRPGLLRDFGIASGMSTVIRGAKRPYGVLGVHSKQPRQFQREEVNFLQCVANILASAIQRQAFITEKEKAEAHLREREEHLRLSLHAGKMGVWDWKLPSGMLTWSSSLDDTAGAQAESFHGTFETFLTFVHPEDRAYVLQEIEKTLRERRDYHIEYRVFKNGATLWLEVWGRLFLDPSGQPERMVGVYMDVTERKQAEINLRQSEERFRTIADAAPVMIWMTDANQNCSYVNKGWREFVKPSADDDISREWKDRIHIDDLQHFLGTTFNAHANRARFQVEYRMRRADGEHRWLLDHGIPRFEPNGSFAGYIGIAIDVTERKRAEAILREEAALRESEARFRELADAMPQIVWTARLDGRFDYFNRRFFEFTGAEPEQPGEEIWRNIVHPEDRPSCIHQWQNSVQHGVTFQKECRLLDGRTGAYRWHLSRALPVFDAKGKIVRWIGTATDIEEQKQSERALHLANDQISRHAQQLERRVAERTAELEASLQSMEGFCYSIAHDLRAPARALQGLTTALIEDYTDVLDEAGRDYARRIISSASRLDHLIKDLLAYGRLSHVEFPAAVIELQASVDRVLADLEREIEAARGHVRAHEPFPQLWANSGMVEQVLTNLICNAIKFVPPGVSPEVEIRSDQRGDFVRIEIRDNGIGIAPEHLDRVFHVFERLHGVDQYPGTGIGLAIVRKGVERMGGRVGVESQVGQGSCFWFELPAASQARMSAGNPD